MNFPNYISDPLLRLLLVEAPGRGGKQSSVTTLDRDLYGVAGPSGA